MTLGIDLAAQPVNTAACFIRWKKNFAKVEVPRLGLTDEQLVKLFGRADKVGIDVPFGWPTAFVEAILSNHRGDKWPSYSTIKLRFRATDLHVHDLTGRWPLSVSTDLIGVVALRAAPLFEQLCGGISIDRTGKGKLVEVYPAAALNRWGFRNWNKKESSKLTRTFLMKTSGWLRVNHQAKVALEASRDAFDALVASLVARASAKGLCEPIPIGCVERAKAEGWIAVPREKSVVLPAKTGHLI